MSKWDTAARLWRDEGSWGVARVVKNRFREPYDLARRRVARWWRKNDHWLVGKWVELRGNRVVIDGCRFSVDHSSVSCKLKSRFYLGRYEAAERDAIARFLDPELPVVEFGGGIGVVSCVANRCLRHPKRHVVVEANPHLLDQIERNRSLNQCAFRLEHKALAYGSDAVNFPIQEQYLASGLNCRTGQTVRVPATSLAALLDARAFATATLICDIEGAEFDLVHEEASVLAARIPLAIIEAHDVPGVGTRQDFRQQVESIGFVCLSEAASTFVFRRS
jgi:FkbM family methyltransferase